MITMFTTRQTAKILGLKPQTLRVWRHKGKGPRYVRYGNSAFGRVSYRQADIENWLDERTYLHTSEETVDKQRSQ